MSDEGGETERAALWARINLTTALLAHAEFRCNSLQDGVQHLQNAIADREREIERCERQIETLLISIGLSEQLIEDLLGSTSWHLTRPLRWTGDVLKKLVERFEQRVR